jgi:hypothetical protein
MPDKDKRSKPYITMSEEWSTSGYILDKNDGKDLKTLESPFSDTENEDEENKK